ELPRVRHRQVNRSRVRLLRPREDPARKLNGRLRPSDDLDVLPGEGARNPDSKRFSDRFLAREAARVRLRAVPPPVPVRAPGRREAPLAEARIALEGATNPGDFDQVHSDSHGSALSKQASCADEGAFLPSSTLHCRTGGAARMKIVRLVIVSLALCVAPS